MFKRFSLAVVTTFVIAGVINFITGRLFFTDLLDGTSRLWRAPADINWWLSYIALFIFTVGFVYVYSSLVSRRTPMTGFMYGLILGASIGIGAAYNLYSFLPMPYGHALSLFLANTVDFALAGWIMGYILRSELVVPVEPEPAHASWGQE
jgi:hypothetical protein